MKYHIMYDMDYKSKETPIQLEIGIAFHEMMEAYYNPEKYRRDNADERAKDALNAFTERNALQREEAIKTNGNPYNMKDIYDDYNARELLAIKVLSQWHDHDRFEFEQRLIPVELEKKLSYTFTNGVTLEGKIDGIFLDTKTNKVWVVDWKHVANLKNGIEDRLEMDDQINFYMLLAYLNGYDVAGFLYVERLKTALQHPEMLSKRYKGRLYSVVKSQPTSYDVAKECFENFDKEAYDKGLYNEYLSYLKYNPYQFTRITKIVRNAQAFDYYLKDLQNAIGSLYEADESSIYGVNNFLCQNCQFKLACSERIRGGDFEGMLESIAVSKHTYYKQEA